MCFADKDLGLSADQYAFRGNHLLMLSGLKDTTLENFNIHGTLYGVEQPIAIENCEGLEKRNCNF